MANVIDFSLIKTSLDEEEPHHSASTTSPKIIFTEAHAVPLISLDELPTHPLPNFDDNVFDING
jgi:hypothetical protein